MTRLSKRSGSRDTASQQRAACEAGETLVASLDHKTPAGPLAVYKQMPDGIPLATKVAVVRNADHIARGLGKEIRQVTAAYFDTLQDVTIVNSMEEAAQDRRVRTVFRINVVAQAGDVIQTAFESTGGLAGFEQVEGDVSEQLRARRGRRARCECCARVHRPPEQCRSSARQKPEGCSSTKRWGTGWKPISICRANRCRSLPEKSDSPSRIPK